MDHLNDTRLDALIFDAIPLAPEEAIHMQGCEVCRNRIAAHALLREELQIAGRSLPTSPQLARYSRLFDEVAVPSLGQRLGSFVNSLRLALVLDSRQSAPALGLRRAAGFGHRLLYSSDQVDVELLVEAEGENWHIEGDVLPFEPDTIAAPYLVELQGDGATDPTPIGPHYAVESETSGRFRLAEVAPGRYRLSLTPARGPAIEIPGLEIP